MDGEGISDGLSAERKVEIRVRRNGRKDEVIVEKSAAEGLPKGWIKKLVITNRKGRKVRRDPFFIDPKSGYTFQSFKDASRYVETGDIGIYARKLKESDIEDDGSGTGKIAIPVESVGKRSAGDLLEKEKKKNVHVRNSKRRYLSSSDEHSGNCKTNSDLSSVTSQVLKDLGKKKQAKVPIEKQPMAKRVTRSQAKASKNEDDADIKRRKLSSSITKSEEGSVISRLSGASSQATEKKSVMKEAEVQNSVEKRMMRSKAKVKTNELSNSVVRRASKRLAGIELEPMLELKTRTKAQRIVPPDDGTAGKCKQPVNPVATGSLKRTDIPLSKEVAKSYNEHSPPNKAVGTAVVISEVELNPVFHLDGYKQKEEMSPVSPLSHQTSATKCAKTATSKRLGWSSPKAKLTSSVKVTENSYLGSSNKGKHPYSFDSEPAIQKRNKLGNELSQSTIVRGACSEMMEKNTNSLSSTFDSTLADLWKDPCIAFAIKTLTGESLRLPNTTAISFDPKNNHTKQKGVSVFPETPRNVNTSFENPGFTSAPSDADIWKDPCIDFAIQTLTGAIPIGLDEPGAKSKTEGIKIDTTTMQEVESRQSNCDYLVQQCNMKNKTVGKSAI